MRSGPETTLRVTPEELESLRKALEGIKDPSTLTRDTGRPPTDEELLIAAWANLAVEEPDLTLEEAREILRGGQRAAPGTT